MTNDHPSRNDRYMRLTQLLSSVPSVRQLAERDGVPDPGEIASEAADGLLDIQESARVLFADLLPRLESLSPESADLHDLLSDIGEEYRHIYYHIVNTRLFEYLVPKP